jgi:type IV secretory pathway component VirB8
MTTHEQRRQNLRLAWTLAAVAVAFAMVLVLKLVFLRA